MKNWNRATFANGARPSIVIQTNEPIGDEAFARMQQQFNDEHTGTENNGKPLIVEGATVTRS